MLAQQAPLPRAACREVAGPCGARPGHRRPLNRPPDRTPPLPSHPPAPRVPRRCRSHESAARWPPFASRPPVAAGPGPPRRCRSPRAGRPVAVAPKRRPTWSSLLGRTPAPRPRRSASAAPGAPAGSRGTAGITPSGNVPGPVDERAPPPGAAIPSARPSRRRAAPSRPEGPTAGGSTRPLPRRPRRASPRTVIAPGAPRCLSPVASACRQVTPGSGGRARNRFPTTPPAVLTVCRLRAYDTDKSVEFSGRA
jgi:hypothetical protein